MLSSARVNLIEGSERVDVVAVQVYSSLNVMMGMRPELCDLSRSEPRKLLAGMPSVDADSIFVLSGIYIILFRN